MANNQLLDTEMDISPESIEDFVHEIGLDEDATERVIYVDPYVKGTTDLSLNSWIQEHVDPIVQFRFYRDSGAPAENSPISCCIQLKFLYGGSPDDIICKLQFCLNFLGRDTECEEYILDIFTTTQKVTLLQTFKDDGLAIVRS